MFINQSKNQVYGDLVGGNKSVTSITINNGSMVSELCLLYEKIKSEDPDDLSDKFCHKLEHYLASVTDGDVRGLEEKLRDSGRLEQHRFALELKEKAAKSLTKYQTSRSAQRVFTIILDDLHTNFTLQVTPAIQAGESRQEVDHRISSILQQLVDKLGENALELTVKDLLAFIYFLGGNCHLRWDKC